MRKMGTYKVIASGERGIRVRLNKETVDILSGRKLKLYIAKKELIFADDGAEWKAESLGGILIGDRKIVASSGQRFVTIPLATGGQLGLIKGAFADVFIDGQDPYVVRVRPAKEGE